MQGRGIGMSLSAGSLIRRGTNRLGNRSEANRALRNAPKLPWIRSEHCERKGQAANPDVRRDAKRPPVLRALSAAFW